MCVYRLRKRGPVISGEQDEEGRKRHGKEKRERKIESYIEEEDEAKIEKRNRIRGLKRPKN